MEMILIGLGFAALYWFAIAKDADGMTRWEQLKLGRTLADMTTVFEQLEHTRATMYIGAGGGIDSLTPQQQSTAYRVFTIGEVRLRAFGPVVTTRGLLNNIRVAASLGREGRVNAQGKLLEDLMEKGLAVHPRTFGI